MQNLEQYTKTVATQSRAAARQLAVVTTQQKIDWLHTVADLLRSQTRELLTANEQDLAQATEFGLNDAAVDRLRLSADRLQSIAVAVEEIADLPDPVGEVIETNLRPNGLKVSRVRVPLGVVFFIYESRPNVTVDAAALCVMSGNAVILRGGKEAFHSNTAFHKLLEEALAKCGMPEHSVQLVSTTDRQAVGHFLKLGDLIDVTIPRGGRSLIERVSSEATMPVIKHFDGICHVYVDKAADLAMAEGIVVNSKCQRPGVCNALETLLVHRDVADEFLPAVARTLVDQAVELRGCERSLPLMPGSRPASDEDYRTEYLDLILSVKTVDSIDDAIDHITEYGSGHTESIITGDSTAADYFTARVDSSAVMVNASTRFNDGGEFGLGAEIGISTGRFTLGARVVYEKSQPISTLSAAQGKSEFENSSWFNPNPTEWHRRPGMADKLSPSEIESLLSAVRADAALLPQTNQPLDERVDLASFDQDAIADSFFQQLMQHTVDGLARAFGLAMAVQNVKLQQECVNPVSPPNVVVEMSNLDGGSWRLSLHLDILLPMAAAALSAPLADFQHRADQKLSFVERQLIMPRLQQAIHYLNERQFPDSPLVIHDASSMNSEPISVAKCIVNGIDNAFTGTLSFAVPDAVLHGHKYDPPASQRDEPTLELMVTLTETQITASEIDELSIGDILMTQTTPDSLLTATIDGRVAYRGTMGIFQGRKALRVAEKVNDPT